MQVRDRSTLFFAILLIGLGVLFLLPSVLPGLEFGFSWPIIFFILALGFYLPSLVWPAVRRELSALFIPGTIMLTLGLIFLYNVATDDWSSWAYSWLLILSGTGLGIFLAAWIGRWGRGSLNAGLWIFSINLALFSLFAMIFGVGKFMTVGPILMMVAGLLLLLRTFIRR